MKKFFLSSISVFVLSLFCFENVYLAEKNLHDVRIATHHKHLEELIDSDEFENLMEKGFSKREIILAAHIAKEADKKVEDVLIVYKEKKQSWEETAKHFGVKLDKYKHRKFKECEYFEKNKNAVINSVAKYSKKSPEQIRAYLLEKDVSLRFIIAGAALAKLSNKDLDEIVTYRKNGKNLYEIIDELDIDEDIFHKEMDKIISGIKEKKDK